jgi:2-desacetyl-2-hydroxyethyl bacteriochlorophyllide A dehydrogenase
MAAGGKLNVVKMQAVWLENNALSLRTDVPIPELLAGEALVKVRLAGICATDLALVKGYYPFSGIPGHEFVGEMVQSPDQPERLGERVVGEINVGCGSCVSCAAGRSSHCERRTVLGLVDRNGAFAEYLCLPQENLIRIPDAVGDDAAVFVEPLAAALEIQQQINIFPTDCVLVLGAGRLGQLTAQTLVLTGCNLQIAARYSNQRKLLTARNINWIDENAIQKRFYDVVVEATGSATGFATARSAVRPGGTVVLKSTYKGHVQVDVSSLAVDEITLVGSRCGPFAPAMRLIEKKMVDPTILIEERYFLDNALEAFEKAAQPGVLKVVLQMGK